MSLNELKKLLKRLGGMLVMDGDKPSFVMLSYDNYKQLEQEAEAYIEVHSASPTDLFDRVGHGEHVAAGNENEEEIIRQLNEEVAMLRQEIKLKEMEEMLPTETPTE